MPGETDAASLCVGFRAASPVLGTTFTDVVVRGLEAQGLSVPPCAVKRLRGKEQLVVEWIVGDDLGDLSPFVLGRSVLTLLEGCGMPPEALAAWR